MMKTKTMGRRTAIPPLPINHVSGSTEDLAILDERSSFYEVQRIQRSAVWGYEVVVDGSTYSLPRPLSMWAEEMLREPPEFWPRCVAFIQTDDAVVADTISEGRAKPEGVHSYELNASGRIKRGTLKPVRRPYGAR